jgi:DNA-binding transcriptional ArsR family regulator
LQPEKCSAQLAALAAPERLQIVRLLSEKPHNVTEITKALGIPPLNVSHHLTVLKAARLINGTKRGRFVIYSLVEGVLSQVEQAGVPCEAINLGCCCVTLPKPANG